MFELLEHPLMKSRVALLSFRERSLTNAIRFERILLFNTSACFASPSTRNFNDAEMSRWQRFSSFDRWSRLLFNLSEERSDSDSFNGWIGHLWNSTFQEQQQQRRGELRTSGGEHRLHAVCWWKLRVRYRVCMPTDIDCLSFDRFYWMNSHYSLCCFRDRLSPSWREEKWFKCRSVHCIRISTIVNSSSIGTCKETDKRTRGEKRKYCSFSLSLFSLPSFAFSHSIDDHCPEENEQ